MENKNIILLKHHPIFDLKQDNAFYQNQLGGDDVDYFIDVTSHSARNKDLLTEFPTIAKDLSPFYIGPVVASDGAVANVFEHWYQCSKVYPCHIDNDGNVTDEYFKWRDEWFKKPHAEKNTRHTNKSLGYEPGDCQFSLIYENGVYKRLNYIETRKRLYIPMYAKMVYNSPTYKAIKKLVDEGKKVALVDFDAYNYYNKDYKNGIYKDINCIKDAINNPRFKAGHAFVLKMLLEGDIDVVDGIVVDKSGILN